jgi:hypothetical protein
MGESDTERHRVGKSLYAPQIFKHGDAHGEALRDWRRLRHRLRRDGRRCFKT